MTIRVRRALVAAIALLAVAGLGGCAPGITAARLGADFGPTFRNMYLLQRRLVGEAGRATADTAAATCHRGGAATPDSGAGDGWSCVAHWPAPDGHTEPLSYDVSVAPDGCYTAQGPAYYVGAQTIRDAHGRSVTNPLFAFDGCLDLD